MTFGSPYAGGNDTGAKKPSASDVVGTAVALLIEHQLGIARKTRSAEEVYRAIEPHMRRLVSLKLRELADAGRIARCTFEVQGPDGLERYERYGMVCTEAKEEVSTVQVDARMSEGNESKSHGVESSNEAGVLESNNNEVLETGESQVGPVEEKRAAEHHVPSENSGLASQSTITTAAQDETTDSASSVETTSIEVAHDLTPEAIKGMFDVAGAVKSDELKRAIIPKLRQTASLGVNSDIALLSVKDAGRAILRSRGINTVGELVSCLDSLKSGTSSDRLLFRDSCRELRARAVPIALNDLRRAAGILLSQANSKEFLFDAFGNLRRLELTNKEAEYRDLSQSLCTRIKAKHKDLAVIKSIYSGKTGEPLAVSMLDIPSYVVKRLQRAGYKGIDSLIKSPYKEIASRAKLSDYDGRQLQLSLRNWKGGELPLGVSDAVVSAVGTNRRIHMWLTAGDLEAYPDSREAMSVSATRRLARLAQDEGYPVFESSFWVLALRLVRRVLAEKKRMGSLLVFSDAEIENLLKHLAAFCRLDAAASSTLIDALIWGSSNRKPAIIALPKMDVWKRAALAISSENESVVFSESQGALFLAASDAGSFEVTQLDLMFNEPVIWADIEHEGSRALVSSTEEKSMPSASLGKQGERVVAPSRAAQSLATSGDYGSKPDETSLRYTWGDVAKSYESLFAEYEVTLEEFEAILTDAERLSIDGDVEKMFASLDEKCSHASRYRRIPLRSSLNNKQLNEDLRKRIKACVFGRSIATSNAQVAGAVRDHGLAGSPTVSGEALVSNESSSANDSEGVAAEGAVGAEPEHSVRQSEGSSELHSIADMDLSKLDEEPGQIDEKPSENLGSNPITLHQWLDSMGVQSREFLVKLFSGVNLRDSAKSLGIRVSQAREMRNSLLAKKPTLDLDRFQYLYEQYALGDDAIASIITEDALSRGYLQFSFKPGRWPLHTSGHDNAIDESLKESIKRYLHKDMPDYECLGYANGEARAVHDGADRNQSSLDEDDEERERGELDEARLVELAAKGDLTSEELIRFILNKQANIHPITIEQFSAVYHAECLKLALDRSTMRLPMNSLGAITNSGRALVVSRDHIRYYDFDSHDFTPLIEAMRAERERNMECSASLPFGWHRNLMDELDIQTPEELHAVLRLIRMKQPIEGVEPDVMPLIKFGSADRRDQIILAMEDLGEASADKLAEEYEERYGVSRDLFHSDQFEGLVQAYCTDGVYSYRATGLSHTQREELRRCLEGEDYISCSLVQSRMKSSFPSLDWASVQDALLSVGYRESGALLVRSDVDERDLFNELIEQNESFKKDTPGFGKDVFSNQTFRSILDSKKRAFDIVEVSDGLYISIHKLETFGIHKWNCEFYVNAAIARTPDEEPFTIHSLRRNGFEHPMDSLRDNAGLDDFFYTSLVSVSAPKRGVRKTACGGSTVFCKTRRTFNMTEFIRAIVKRHGVIYINELVDLLEDEYGVLQTDSRLIRIVEEDAEGADGASHMFYGSSLGLVAASPKAAAAEKERLILGGKQAR